jgi:hypothetical protein
MKDYSFVGRYTKEEWETDLMWKAQRLDFIWRFASKNPQEYLENEMNEEKHDFYAYPEVISVAYNL